MLIQTLARTSNIDEHKLLSLAETADVRYKVYSIPKRSGGHRTIEHPSRELKAIQRWITKALVDRFPVHQCATAYRKGSGIRENAERHRTSKYTNRYDFSNFFPSFSQGKVEGFIQKEAVKLGIKLTPEDLGFVGNIVCRQRRLTIGAPSSPALTNAMMFDFDRAFFEVCNERGLIFTRYADDIFVSSDLPDRLVGLEGEIRKAKRNVEHISLRMNHKKTAYLSKKHSRKITGVVITPDHKLSIGRSRKREIKALVHRWVNGKLEQWELFHMRGLLAFARDIEPKFEESLRVKYGHGVINEILRHPCLGATPDPEFQPPPVL